MHKKMDEVIAAQAAADAAAAQQQPPASNGKPNQLASRNPPSTPVNPTPKPPKQPASTLPPIAAPDLPISAEKKQQLDALLSRYRADQITPDQYQAERAKILQGN
jgi:hypothetical protein